jgi:hypothetical protein
MVSGGAFAQAVWAAFGPRPEAHARQLVRSRSTTLPTGAGSRRFSLLSALRAHTEAPYKTDLLWEMLRTLNRRGRARTAGTCTWRRGRPRGANTRGLCTAVAAAAAAGQVAPAASLVSAAVMAAAAVAAAAAEAWTAGLALAAAAVGALPAAAAAAAAPGWALALEQVGSSCAPRPRRAEPGTRRTLRLQGASTCPLCTRAAMALPGRSRCTRPAATVGQPPPTRPRGSRGSPSRAAG